MFNFETGKIVFPQFLSELKVDLTKTYSNDIVVKITTTDNVNINLREVANNYFTVEKSILEEITVHYIVIES